MTHKVPLLPILLSVIGGIILAYYFNIEWWGLLLYGLTSICVIISNRIYLSILLISFLLGYSSLSFSKPRLQTSQWVEQNLVCTGTIESIKIGNAGLNVIVNINDACSKWDRLKFRNVKMLLHIPSYETDLIPFDVVSFSCKPNLLTYDPDLPGDYDYSKIFKNNNVIFNDIVSISKFKLISHKSDFQEKLFLFRSKLIESINEYGLSDKSAGFLCAIFLGDSNQLSSQQKTIYSNAGITHMLALSGTHVALVSSIILCILIPFRRWGLRNLAYIICIIFMWFYAFMTGLSDSVVRATVMMSVLFLGYISSRKPNSINSLCFAAIIILIFNPTSLFSPSFQLSFGAVAAILLFSHFFISKSHNKLVNFILCSFFLSVIAIIGTGLLSAYYFHTFPLYSAITNLPAALILPPLLGASLLIIITGMLGWHFSWLIYFVDFAHEILYDFCEMIGNLPFSVISDIVIDPISFIPYVIFLLLLYFFMLKRSYFYFLATALGFMILLPFFLIKIEHVNNGIYIWGNSRDTQILARMNNDIYHTSIHTPFTSDNIMNKFLEDHNGFVLTYNINNINTFKTSQINSPAKRDNNLIEINGKKILILTDKHSVSDIENELELYACIICCPFNEDLILSIAERHKIFSMILPRELHHNHILKYIELFESHNIPYFSLRSGKWWHEF